MRLASWGSDLVDLLLPAGCVACRAWIPGGRAAPLVCDRCRSLLREAPWPRCVRCHHPLGTGGARTDSCRECEGWPEALTGARHAFVLGHPADDLVHALKYEGWPELAGPMGDAMALRARSVTDSSASRVVVPVPTTGERIRRRGYNQSALLAGRVAEALRLPVCDALERIGSRPSQTTLPPRERRENVRGVFRAVAHRADGIRGTHALLIDDVLTTGATASEAALVLSEAGAVAVTLLTFGRALATAPESAL